MDQATVKVASLDPGHDAHRLDVARSLRRSKVDPAVRALGVVVLGIGLKNTVQVAAAEDQGPAEDLVTECLHAALSERIGPG